MSQPQQEQEQQDLNEVVEGLTLEEARAAILNLSKTIHDLEQQLDSQPNPYQGTSIGFIRR